MDLAFALRIDTDLESLIVLNENPTGVSMLDGMLAKIVAQPKVMDAQSWVRLLASDEANTIREQALAGLVARGILERRERRRVGRYPMRDGTAQRDVKQHIREVVVSDDIPDPRDVARVSLVDARGIFPEILSEREIKQATGRIRQLRIMDLIGREVAGAIAAIQRTMLMAIRARLARFRKYLLALAAIGGFAALGTILVPRIPIPDRFGPTLLERLWGDGAWQEWSGYVLLGLSVAGLAAASLMRVRFASGLGDQNWWRLVHVGLGMSCVLLLFAHTGFRLGSNLNAALMGCYIAALLSGACAGVLMGGATQLRRFGFAQVGNLSRLPMRVHIIALGALPALLIIHLLVVYLYRENRRVSRNVLFVIVSTAGTLIAVVVVVVLMIVGGDRRALLIGATTGTHHQLEMACETRHAAPAFADAQTAEKELNKTCRDCHEDALDDDDDSHSRKRFRSPRMAAYWEQLDARVCTTCHVEHRPEITRASAVTVAMDFCVACHSEGDQDIRAARPNHADLSFDTCASSGCHNYHNNRALYEDFLVKHAGQPRLTAEPVHALSAQYHAWEPPAEAAIGRNAAVAPALGNATTVDHWPVPTTRRQASTALIATPLMSPRTTCKAKSKPPGSTRRRPPSAETATAGKPGPSRSGGTAWASTPTSQSPATRTGGSR